MRYVLRHKRNRRRVLENYQRELTTVEVDGDLYYAYINDQNQVEAGCVEHPSWHMILAEGKARSHYGRLCLGEERGALFLLYDCFESMQNRYLLGVLYFFPTRQEKIICTSSHGKLHYAAFGLDKKQYLCVSARDAQGEEVIRLFRREKRDFVPVL